MPVEPQGRVRAGGRGRAADPARPRLIARARRTAQVVLLGVFTVVAASGWAASTVVVLALVDPGEGDRGALLRWLVAAHLVVLALVVVAALVVARRSTRFVEGVFRQEDRLMRAVAHEVRSPVSRLLSVVDLGTSGALAPSTALKEAGREAERLTVLIDDLTEGARVLSGASPLGATPVRLDLAVAALAGRHPRGRADVLVEAEPGVVVGNPRLLRLAVDNLVRNAVQHGYATGPGVVRVRADRRGISVVDDGPGVPPAELARLTVVPKIGLPQELAGLGLVLADWVAAAHGGRLVLANRPGRGFEARLDLPVRPVGDVVVDGPASPEGAAGPARALQGEGSP